MNLQSFGTGGRGWVTLIACWGALGTALVVWLARTAPVGLREQLKTLQFWSLEACFLLVLLSALVVFRDLWRQLGRGHWLRMFALAALGCALTLFVAPRTNRIYYDEQIYQSIGHNMADLRRAQMCLEGTVEYGRLDCTAGEYNKQPYAYPHLLSVLYRIGGADRLFAFALNAAANALAIVAVYLIVLRLFDDAIGAFFAGLVFALIPQQLLWSATAAVEPLAALFCALAVAFTAQFIRTRTTVALLAAALTTAYAIQFRPESMLVVPVVLLLLAVLAPGEFKQHRLWWIGALCFGLVAVHLAHLFAVRNEGWGTSEARFSLDYLRPNFSVNGRFYVADERFPVAYTLLAAVGLIGAGFAALRLVMLLYFLLFLTVTLLFYAGSYNYGADIRYSLMTYPPIAVLAGLGASQLVTFLQRWQPQSSARALVAGALAFQFLWYAPLVRATTEEAWAARADVSFAEAMANELPDNSFVLTHNPGMFHLWGVNAGQMFLALDNPARLHYLTERYAGGVYLHWNFWCNVSDPVQQDLCRRVLAMAPSEVFREHRYRDQRFGFFRFRPSPAPGSSLDAHTSTR